MIGKFLESDTTPGVCGFILLVIVTASVIGIGCWLFCDPAEPAAVMEPDSPNRVTVWLHYREPVRTKVAVEVVTIGGHKVAVVVGPNNVAVCSLDESR